MSFILYYVLQGTEQTASVTVGKPKGVSRYTVVAHVAHNTLYRKG
jgi:hypothetical protein